jgi:hypothetical protein
MQKLMLAEGVMDNLEYGNKLVTIRKGRRDIALGELLFESVEIQREAIVVVTKVIYCRLIEVPTEYYEKDGFESREHMLEGMRTFYPDLTWDSEVTVIEFNRG